MVRGVSKYSLLSISPPQSRFEGHNALELQPITERRTGPLHRRSAAPYHLYETRILRFTVDHLRASRAVGTWLLSRRLPTTIGRSPPAPLLRQLPPRAPSSPLR